MGVVEVVDEAGEDGAAEDQDDLEITILETIVHVIKQAIMPMAMGNNSGMTCKQHPGIACGKRMMSLTALVEGYNETQIMFHSTITILVVTAAAQVGITTGKRGGETAEVTVAADTSVDLAGVDLEVMIHRIIVDEERSTNIGTRIVQGGKEVEAVMDMEKGRSIRSTNMIKNTLVVMMTSIIVDTIVIDLDQDRN